MQLEHRKRNTKILMATFELRHLLCYQEDVIRVSVRVIRVLLGLWLWQICLGMIRGVYHESRKTRNRK